MNFGQRRHRLSPNRNVMPTRPTSAGVAAAGSPWNLEKYSAPLCMCFEQGFNGRPCPACSAVPAASMPISENGQRQVSFSSYGRKDLPSTMRWRGLPGAGRALTEALARHRWQRRLLVQIQQTGGKKGTKRHTLVEEHGLPLSIVVTGANRHDVTQVEAVLSSRVRKPRGRKKQNLCADAGYDSKKALEVMQKFGYLPHVRSRGKEREEMSEGKRPRRWIVEVAHSWFNRFRKILVRFEKTLLSYEGLLQLAAAIIIFRKLGVIYG